jgi:tetratricopeptide (TPR) repeat protein
MGCSPDCRLLWLLLASIVLSGPVLRAQLQGPYAAAIEKYRAADIDGALATLAALDDDRVWSEVKLFWRQPVQEAGRWLPLARAAVLLHTEAWIKGIGGPTRPRVHLDSARALVRSLEPIANDGEFVRDWYLLVTSHLHGRRDIGSSRSLLAEARRLFPRDGQILLASGSDHETLSGMSSGAIEHTDPGGRPTTVERIDGRRELAGALRFYREAAQVAPELDEVQLRLGRVLHRGGDLDDAARVLEAVRKRTAYGPVKYLANVFLGMVEVDRGQLSRASELYVEAARAYPNGQTAFLGLSEVAYLEGRPATAAERVSSLVTRPKDDHWWSYLLGEWWHFDARMRALREAVQR